MPLLVKTPSLPLKPTPALLLGGSHLPHSPGWVSLCLGTWVLGLPAAFLGTGATPNQLWAVRKPRPIVSQPCSSRSLRWRISARGPRWAARCTEALKLMMKLSSGGAPRGVGLQAELGGRCRAKGVEDLPPCSVAVPSVWRVAPASAHSPVGG